MTPTTPLQLPVCTKLPDDFERWLSDGVPLPTSNLLFAHGDDLRNMTGTSFESGLAIGLVSLAAVIGPGLRILNPIGAPLPASVNVLSTDAHGGIRRGVDLSLRSFTSELKPRLDLRMLRGANGRQCEIRAAHAEYEELVQAADQMAANGPASPQTDPKLAAAIQKRDTARRRVGDAQFADRSWVLAEELTAHGLPGFISKSFDRGMLFCPRNVAELVAEPEVLHHFLLAGWYGRVVEITPGECCSPVISNVWLGAGSEVVGAGIDSPLATLLATFFTARSGDRNIKLTGVSDLKYWEGFVAKTFQSRIRGGTGMWQLSPNALAVFEKFCNDLHDLTAGLSPLQTRLVELWPEQLLKVGLLCAVASPDTDPSTISAAVVQQAGTALRLLGREQLLHHPLLQPSAAKLDPEIAGLLAKVRLHGPLSPRALCRRYHKRPIDQLELLLARASELGVLTIINGNVQIVSGALPVSVSACQRPMSEISKTHEITP